MNQVAETITDASELAKEYCKWLESVADYVTGEPFRDSDKNEVYRTDIHELDDEEETKHQFSFKAVKEYDDNTDEFVGIRYEIELSEGKPSAPNELDEKPRILAHPDHRDNEDDEMEEREVATIWKVHKFLIDDIKYEPRREISFDYYDERDLLINFDFLEGGERAELEAELHIDLMLSLLADSIRNGFHELDQLVINGILKQLRLIGQQIPEEQR